MDNSNGIYVCSFLNREQTPEQSEHISYHVNQSSVYDTVALEIMKRIEDIDPKKRKHIYHLIIDGEFEDLIKYVNYEMTHELPYINISKKVLLWDKSQSKQYAEDHLNDLEEDIDS